MNKKQSEYREPPDWLVNLVIRLRVARWRLAERLQRWAVNQKPWRLRLYFMLFIMAGGAAYCMLLLGALHRGKEHRKWKQKIDIPAVQHDGQPASSQKNQK